MHSTSPAAPAGTHAHSSTSVEDHAALVRELLAPAVARTTDPDSFQAVGLADALGRVTAVAVTSPVDLPLFRNSQMDGFAVHTADLHTLPATLPVVGEVAARPGNPAALVAGTAVRIMTGAPVPDDADAIIPVEDTSVATSLGIESVTITRGRAIGEYVRDRGSDVSAGTELLPAGLRLAPRHLAVLAAAGIATVTVRPRPRVAVLTTGAELVAPGEVAGAGQVFDANSIALTSAVRAIDAEVSFVARVVDDHAIMLAALREAAAASDIVLTSGGISKGEYEVVREVLGPLGARVGHIAMQPGGPQTTAVFDGVPVISFPGNPVSTQISFEVFVAPILREVAGLPAATRPVLRLVHDIRSVPGKRQFLRGRTLGDGRVEQVAGPGSHLVAGLAASDVLIDVPTETLDMKAGDTVETWQL
ncbi:gephyrin-like molybdotransferase Glp [Glaciihabitans sp. dw_435]|uniref:molybdopterin molybdotransferase MoeA n=1 Tax=Glaciihabitans sp. dw_435 TaxID=2720081 RepID=UPI001BD63C8E|nr:gephyrin-like molybdotransferase Glp [Glaciihabitans sp. dw_435]